MSLSLEEAQKAQQALKDLADVSSSLSNLPIEERTQEVTRLLEESIATDHRPKGWKSGTIATYYNRRHAFEIKEWLDEMFVDKQDRYFDRKRFLVSSNTLYLKINQAWLWLSENHEDKDKYALMRRCVEIRKIRNGVHVKWKFPVDDLKQITNKPEVVANESNWREELETFTEEAEENQLFERTRIGASEEELKLIRESLMGIHGFHIIKLEREWIKILYKKESVPK